MGDAVSADSDRIGAIIAAMAAGDVPMHLLTGPTSAEAMEPIREYLEQTTARHRDWWATAIKTMPDALSQESYALTSHALRPVKLPPIKISRDSLDYQPYVEDTITARMVRQARDAAPIPSRVRMSQATLDSLRAVSEPPAAPRYSFDGSLASFASVPIQVDPDLADGVIEPDYPGDTKTLPGEDQP